VVADLAVDTALPLIGELGLFKRLKQKYLTSGVQVLLNTFKCVVDQVVIQLVPIVLHHSEHGRDQGFLVLF
jgi:hypothetical protein